MRLRMELFAKIRREDRTLCGSRGVSGPKEVHNDPVHGRGAPRR